eukprot:Clim_evm84s109 gene=Clim_evmTU84s109
MQFKQVYKSSETAFSPGQLKSTTLVAAGTAAKQLDASFSTSSELEVYSLETGDAPAPQPAEAGGDDFFAKAQLRGPELKCLGKTTCQERFNTLQWGSFGMSAGRFGYGVIAGGFSDGSIGMWDAKALAGNASGQAMAPVAQLRGHGSGVNTLDFNTFMPNLMASGAGRSEIFIWDLNTGKPMAPGQSSTEPADITALQWNRQVQHILGSTNINGMSTVWDLRANRAVINFHDNNARMRNSALQWHPDEATQLATASEDDRHPVIQIWELRNAYSPLRTMQGHQSGVLDLAWNPADSDMLLSCGKDNRLLLWNPNTAEMTEELPQAKNWCFDVNWCPSNPSIFSCGSFDGTVRVGDILEASGGASDAQAQGQYGQQPTAAPKVKPPKWLKRPCGAVFGFGGKLYEFSQPTGGQIKVQQTVTEQELVSKAVELSQQSQDFGSLCDSRLRAADSDSERLLWGFLKVNFDAQPRKSQLELMGYSTDSMAYRKVKEAALEGDALANRMQSELNIAQKPVQQSASTADLTGEEQTGTQMNGTGPSPGADGADGDVFASIGKQVATGANGSHLPAITSSFGIALHDGDTGPILRALIAGDFQTAVSLSIAAGRHADALILAMAGGPELLNRARDAYLGSCSTDFATVLGLVLTGNWGDLVQFSKLENWRETFAMLVTYGSAEEFSNLCIMLAERLEEANESVDAALIYIAGGNLDGMLRMLLRLMPPKPSVEDIHSLMEKVNVLAGAVNAVRSDQVTITSTEAVEHIIRYAETLTDQGMLLEAMQQIKLCGPVPVEQNHHLGNIRDRIYHALKPQLQQMVGGPPEAPYTVQNAPVAQAQTAQYGQQQQTGGYGQQSRTSTGYQQPQQTGYGGFGQQQTSYGQYGQQPPSRPSYGAPPPAMGGAAPPPAMGGPPTYGAPPTQTAPPPAFGGAPAVPAHFQQASSYSQPAPPTANILQPAAPPTASAPPPSGPPPAVAGAPPPSAAPHPPAAGGGSLSQPTNPAGTGGWNEPPIIERKKKASQSHRPQAAAIMSPVAPPVGGAPAPGYPGQTAPAPGAGYGTPPMPGAASYGTGSVAQYGQQPPGAVAGAPPGGPAQPVAPQPPAQPPAPPKPILEKFKPIHDVLQGLIDRGKAKNDSTITRKLQDVESKLQPMFDLMREDNITDAEMGMLTQLIQYIQANDLQTAYRYTGQITTQMNLHKFKSSLTGIKSLITIAMKF